MPICTFTFLPGQVPVCDSQFWDGRKTCRIWQISRAKCCKKDPTDLDIFGFLKKINSYLLKRNKVIKHGNTKSISSTTPLTYLSIRQDCRLNIWRYIWMSWQLQYLSPIYLQTQCCLLLSIYIYPKDENRHQWERRRMLCEVIKVGWVGLTCVLVNTQRLTATHKRVVALPAHRPHMLLTSVLVGMNLEKSLFCLLFLFLNALVANSEQEEHRVRDVAEEETELVVAAIYKVGTFLLSNFIDQLPIGEGVNKSFWGLWPKSPFPLFRTFGATTVTFRKKKSAF